MSASSSATPVAVLAETAPLRPTVSNYPPVFAARMAGRSKQALGDFFGLSKYGVNRTRLMPGAVSALRHAHRVQDEFIYVLEGHPTLYTDEGATALSPGMCAGFRGGNGNAHCLVNEADHDAVFLEIGDRSPGDDVVYPDDDLKAERIEGAWRFTRKDGTPY